MGIYDREYYRGETSGSGWLTGLAPACKTIIFINVIVFVIQGFLEQGPRNSFLREYLMATSEGIFHQGRIWQLVTATFLHADMFHLLWNMLFLWMAGREMESLYGSHEFTALYITAAIVSTFGWAVLDIRHDGTHVPMLGASGAVMAIVVLYAMYYPHREVLLFFVIPIEIWLLVVIFLARDALGMLQGQSLHDVAVAAHLSGAGYGFLYKYFDLRWSRLSWSRLRRPRLRLVIPDPRDKPSSRPPGPTWSPNPPTAPKPSSTAVLPEEQLDARLDEILAKIAREGRASLSDEENRVLQEASRRARNRRSDRI